MDSKVSDEVKGIFQRVKEWLTLEVEYIKLSAVEKLIVLISSLIFVILLFVVGLVVLLVFAMALIDLFSLFMPHAMACVTVGGIYLLLLGVLYLLRTPLVYNPIAKLITKLFLTPKNNDGE